MIAPLIQNLNINTNYYSIPTFWLCSNQTNNIYKISSITNLQNITKILRENILNYQNSNLYFVVICGIICIEENMMERVYRIIDKSGCRTIEAETPQMAIEKLYKDYDIQIKISSQDKATHKVELIDSERRSIRYYIVSGKALNRKAKPENYIEPMPKKQLQKIVKEFKAKGGLILMNEESERHLQSQNAEAVTYNSELILLKRNPGRSAVYEELIHAEQFRQGKNDGSYEKRLLCEIEAQKELIRKKEEFGITDVEDRQTRLALKAYEEEYKEYKRNNK